MSRRAFVLSMTVLTISLWAAPASPQFPKIGGTAGGVFEHGKKGLDDQYKNTVGKLNDEFNKAGGSVSDLTHATIKDIRDLRNQTVGDITGLRNATLGDIEHFRDATLKDVTDLRDATHDDLVKARTATADFVVKALLLAGLVAFAVLGLYAWLLFSRVQKLLDAKARA